MTETTTDLVESTDDLPFYLMRQTGFAEAGTDCEFLHPQFTGQVPADTLTETQFFSFMVPEENIFGMGYTLIHPNLRSLTGGAWVWQGVKKHALSCEIFDFRAFVHDRLFENDLWDYELANSYRVRVIEPLKRHHLTYSDAERGNELDIHFDAIIPPVLFGDGKHFEQPMRARGGLTLRGATYQIDCKTIRDRSWGKPRPEAPVATPPIAWNTVVFSDDFAINCNALDHPDLDPDYSGIFDVSPDAVLKSGWVYKDGDLRLITACRKRTIRDAATLHPTAIEMTITDDRDEVHVLTGEVTASSDWTPWPNLRWVVGMVRWRCDGLVAFGETQEPHFTDYLSACLK